VRALAVAGLVAAAALPARAQTTGAIAGRMTDRGAPLDGVRVVASGEALQGEASAVTDQAGEFVLSLLPPGRYALEVEKPGYVSFTLEDLAVHADEVLRVEHPLLPLAAAAAAQGATEKPAVSVPTTWTGGVISREQMELIPYGRDFRSFEGPVPSVPGVLRDFSMLGTPGPLARVDGASVAGARFLQNFVDEVSVQTGGYQAEYGGTSSGIIDVVTRSGGNDFHGSLFGSFLPGPRAAGDGGFDLGGPLQRDRLWFYGGFAPAAAGSQREWNYVGKLSFRPAEDQSLSLSGFGDGGSAGSLRYLGKLFERSMDVEATAAWDQTEGAEGLLKLTNRFELAGHHQLRYGGEGTSSWGGAFAQDTWSVVDAFFLEEGVRVEQRSGFTQVMPRIGASWDFTGRGQAKAYAFYGRFQHLDQALGGVQYQVLGDAVASVEYAHTGKPYDTVMVALRKPFSQSYLLQASYAWPTAVKLDAAYVYEWTAKTSASAGVSFHAIRASPWDTQLAARAALTHALSPSYLLTGSLDVFSNPADLRLGVRLSF